MKYSPALTVTLATLLAFLSTATAYYTGKLSLPPAYRPTSAVSIVTHDEEAHLFYRAADSSLAHVVLDFMTGNVVRKAKLGGILLSAPTAVATTLTASKLSIDLVYLSTGNTVTMRLFRNGAWSAASAVTGLPARTVFAPALAPTVAQDGRVQMYLTAPNRHVVMVTLRDGKLVRGSKPVWFGKLLVDGAPTALNTRLPKRSGIQLYVRELRTGALYASSTARNQQVFRPVAHMRGITSGVCAASIGEGGQIVIGTSVTGTPQGVALFKHLMVEYPKHGDLAKSTWITERPACTYWQESCSLIVMNQGETLLTNLYCN